MTKPSAPAWVAPDVADIVESLPRVPTSQYWRTRPLSSITKIVVHYDGVEVPLFVRDDSAGYDPVARYTEQARYHIGKNWNDYSGATINGFGLMYHYRVSTDGRIWRTQPEELITWHARGANAVGLAVCCDLGPGQCPPAAQLDGLRRLLDYLCHHRPDIPAGRADVWGHGELIREGNATACPGSLLPWLREYRVG